MMVKKVDERAGVVEGAVEGGDNVDSDELDLSALFDEEELGVENVGEGEEEDSGEDSSEGSSGESSEEDSSGEDSGGSFGVPPPLLQEEVDAGDSSQEVSREELEKKRQEAAEQLERYFAGLLAGDEFDDPREVLPKVLARSYLDMYGSVVQQVEQQVVPKRVQEQVAVMQEAQRIEMAFYRRWPQLAEAARDAEKLKVIQRSLRTYRQANPDVPVEQAIEEAGAMAVVALRVPLRKRRGGAGKGSGFRPAAPGASAGASSGGQQTQDDNVFVAMAEEMIEDDEV